MFGMNRGMKRKVIYKQISGDGCIWGDEWREYELALGMG